METTPKATELKSLMKEAFIEILEERRDLFYGLVEETMEDIALAHAIDEGLESETVGREEVMDVLKGAA